MVENYIKFLFSTRFIALVLMRLGMFFTTDDSYLITHIGFILIAVFILWEQLVYGDEEKSVAEQLATEETVELARIPTAGIIFFVALGIIVIFVL